jgi:hypothetical protein
MIPEVLELREKELRLAVERRQFGAVDSLIASFCGLADEHLGSLTPDNPIRYEIITRVLTVLEWARLMLYTARADCSDQLERLFWANRYLDRPDRVELGVQLDL